MGVINYNAERQLLVTARGHPYERDPFMSLFDGLEDFSSSLVEQPAAQMPKMVDGRRSPFGCSPTAKGS